jgi:hypothetical protein
MSAPSLSALSPNRRRLRLCDDVTYIWFSGISQIILQGQNNKFGIDSKNRGEMPQNRNELQKFISRPMDSILPEQNFNGIVKTSALKWLSGEGASP